MASKLASAVFAGLAGSIAISCFLVALDIAIRVYYALIGRAYNVDEMASILLLMLWLFVLIPIFLAVTGALSIRISGHHVSDAVTCTLTSLAAGLIAIALAVALFYFISAYFVGPLRFDEISLRYETRYFVESVIGAFTSLRPLAGMLIYSLFAVAGGIVYYKYSAKRRARAKNG